MPHSRLCMEVVRALSLQRVWNSRTNDSNFPATEGRIARCRTTSRKNCKSIIFPIIDLGKNSTSYLRRLDFRHCFNHLHASTDSKRRSRKYELYNGCGAIADSRSVRRRIQRGRTRRGSSGPTIHRSRTSGRRVCSTSVSVLFIPIRSFFLLDNSDVRDILLLFITSTFFTGIIFVLGICGMCE